MYVVGAAPPLGDVSIGGKDKKSSDVAEHPCSAIFSIELELKSLPIANTRGIIVPSFIGLL